MTKILIIYATTTGNTQRMAEAVADGARSVPDTEVLFRDALSATKEEAQAADGLIIGTPLRHRSADSRVKQFIENVVEVLWLTDDLVGKVGGVFSVGGGYGNTGAGVEIAQLGLLAALAGAGMILIPLPKTTPGAEVAGSHWGVHGRSGGPQMQPIGVTDEMLQCGFHHGANITRVARELAGKNLLARGNVAPSSELIAMFSGGGKPPAG